MRRSLVAAVAVLALGSGLARAASGPAGAYLESFVCHPSLDPAQRTVSVTAVMPTMPGTVRLKMRFQLAGRRGGQIFLVHGGDLDRWISPNPITLGQLPGDVWIETKPVTGVPVPATYRFKVDYRWVGAGGHVLAVATRWSSSCRQPDLRPDLVVRSILVEPLSGAADMSEYVAAIGNDGLSTATAVEVLFQPGGGAPSQSATIPRLRPDATRKVTFTGPACTAATAPRIAVDPYDRIDVTSRAHSSMTVTCPGASAT